MDPLRNPYAPGAGTPPPELAGRTDLIEAARLCLGRTRLGRPSQSMIMVGLRGVGKTVLLNRIKALAAESGMEAAVIEAHEGKSLPELLLPSLRSMLYQMSLMENAKDKARRGMRVLKSFLNGLTFTYNNIEVGLSIDSEPGSADSGDLEADLPALITAVAEAAKAAGRSIAILIDELQYLTEKEFSALIMAIHRINQDSLPLVMIGAGLPQILSLAGNSKSYAERLFRFPDVGALNAEDAIAALINPAKEEGVQFDDDALDIILTHTERYPYFLQQWAYESWNVATDNRINRAAVEKGTELAIKELDQSFFKVRFDRCTPSEKRYMRALAELGHGKHRSGDVAEKLRFKTASVAPTRSALIRKGMIYSPSHGDTAFTVPLFDEYMLRVMPDLQF